jgi:hypothetical protein
LTVRGCTFYGNVAQRGGAIYRVTSGDVTLTGNLFIGNTAKSDADGHVVYGTTTSGGYNVSDNAAGNDTAGNGSGYKTGTDDTFSIGSSPVSPGSFKPFSESAAAGKLPDTLPEGYPELDFYGQTIPAGGAAGAVKAQ